MMILFVLYVLSVLMCMFGMFCLEVWNVRASKHSFDVQDLGFACLVSLIPIANVAIVVGYSASSLELDEVINNFMTTLIKGKKDKE